MFINEVFSGIRIFIIFIISSHSHVLLGIYKKVQSKALLFASNNAFHFDAHSTINNQGFIRNTTLLIASILSFSNSYSNPSCKTQTPNINPFGSGDKIYSIFSFMSGSISNNDSGYFSKYFKSCSQ